jgi:bacteriorhodopsin
MDEDETTHTKWFWGECAVFVVCYLYVWLTMFADRSPSDVASIGMGTPFLSCGLPPEKRGDDSPG